MNKDTMPMTVMIDPHHVCNFKCPYCFNPLKHKSNYPSMFSHRPVDAWIEKISELPGPVIVTMSGIGEPVAVREMFPFVRGLEALDNVSQVIIVTNTGLKEMTAPYLNLSEKVFFEASFHPSDITMDTFKENIQPLLKNEKLKRVWYLAYQLSLPERAAMKLYTRLHGAGLDLKYREIRYRREKLLEYKEEMDRLGVPFLVLAPDYRFWCAFNKKERKFLSQFRLPEEGPYNFDYPRRHRTRGVPCYSGMRRMVLTSNGNIRRCTRSPKPRNIVGLDELEHRHVLKKFGLRGNLFEGYQMFDRPEPCPWKYCSHCIQDYTCISANQLYFDEQFVRVIKES